MTLSGYYVVCKLGAFGTGPGRDAQDFKYNGPRDAGSEMGSCRG